MSIFPPTSIKIPAGATVRVHRMGDSPVGSDTRRPVQSQTVVVPASNAAKPDGAPARRPIKMPPQLARKGKPTLPVQIEKALEANGNKPMAMPALHDQVGGARSPLVLALSSMTKAGRLIREGTRRYYTYRLPLTAQTPGSNPAPTGPKPPPPPNPPPAPATRERIRGNIVAGVTIEDDVPIQTKRTPGKLFPVLDALKVGQSFSYHIHINLSHMRDRLKGKKFYQTKDPKDGTRIRIWRTA